MNCLKIIYFIGPLDGFGNSIGADYMAIGLQMFLGDTSSWYQSEQIQKYFPTYMSRNFTPRFIPITAAKNLLQDIAPNSNLTQGLIIEMIEMGKRQYILKKYYLKIMTLIYLVIARHNMRLLSKQNRIFGTIY